MRLETVTGVASGRAKRLGAVDGSERKRTQPSDRLEAKGTYVRDWANDNAIIIARRDIHTQAEAQSGVADLANATTFDAAFGSHHFAQASIIARRRFNASPRL